MHMTERNKMGALEIKVQRLHPDAAIPVYQKEGDAGFDLTARADTVIPAGGAAVIPTGLAFAIPDGFEMQIRLRSGAALKTPLIIANAPGTIDSGYRGEVGVIARNLSASDWLVKKGDRIAQGVITPVCKALFIESEELPPSARGAAGFGSTDLA